MPTKCFIRPWVWEPGQEQMDVEDLFRPSELLDDILSAGGVSTAFFLLFSFISKFASQLK
jgi:hypothetical protein